MIHSDFFLKIFIEEKILARENSTVFFTCFSTYQRSVFAFLSHLFVNFETSQRDNEEKS
jgi:hypothetical protein